MKTYSLDEAKDELVGKQGTPERAQYEFELKLELVGDMIQQARKQRNLTQEKSGKLIGERSPNLRLENNTAISHRNYS